MIIADVFIFVNTHTYVYVYVIRYNKLIHFIGDLLEFYLNNTPFSLTEPSHSIENDHNFIVWYAQVIYFNMENSKSI